MLTKSGTTIYYHKKKFKHPFDQLCLGCLSMFSWVWHQGANSGNSDSNPDPAPPSVLCDSASQFTLCHRLQNFLRLSTNVST